MNLTRLRSFKLSGLDWCLIGIIIVLTCVCGCFWSKSKQREKKSPQPLDIGALIDSVKEDLVRSRKTQLEKGRGDMFAVQSVDLEIKFTVSKTTSGDGRVELNVASAGAGDTASNELVQTIKLHMTALPQAEKSAGPGIKTQ